MRDHQTTARRFAGAMKGFAARGMRISSKGRYGLAAMITLAQHYASGSCMTVISLSERLGISKIYLEQVFALLKKAELVNAAKGAQGGYRLAKPPAQTSVYEVLSALELSLFEKTVPSVAQKAENVEAAMQECVFSVLDSALRKELEGVTLADLAAEAAKRGDAYMFYI